jgi:hypothetical protein
MRRLLLGVVALSYVAGAGCSNVDNAPAKAPDKPVMMPPKDARKTVGEITPAAPPGGGKS